MEAIRIDLPRTFPENVFFENIRTPLFNVLVAYANHNKEIGYCQGLNYIAGEYPMMLIFENKFQCGLQIKCKISISYFSESLSPSSGLILIVTKNEEWTFWLLKILIEDITQNYHTKTMRGLIMDIGVLRELVDARAPEICQHLDKHGMPFPVVTTKWFICMFAEVLPVETVLRVWDCLFLEGSKVGRHSNALKMKKKID